MKTLLRLVLSLSLLSTSLLGQPLPAPELVVEVDEADRQFRVEAMDSATGEWVPAVTAYRQSGETGEGWMKIRIPETYAESRLRVQRSARQAPFADHIASHEEPAAIYSGNAEGGNFAFTPDGSLEGGGGEGSRDDSEIEEADIWTYSGDTLFFYNQYRGLQVLDLSNPKEPDWLDYFRFPGKGENLYTHGDNRLILLSSGHWQGGELAVVCLNWDGTELAESAEILLDEGGSYVDSRRIGDVLYILTQRLVEGPVEEIGPDGEVVRQYGYEMQLHSVRIADGEEAVIDRQSFQSDGHLSGLLTAQPGVLLLGYHQYGNRWNGYQTHSQINVYQPDAGGIPVLEGSARPAGVVSDKFKLRYKEGILTTISQQQDRSSGQLSRETRLENFRFGPNGTVARIGSLSLAPGETLFATRFLEDTVYVVTFLFKDPLFAIDNSDPANPRTIGELEVPGWSTYLQFIEDKLFSIGWEENRLVLSFFDVADPANMILQSRVALFEDSWAFSEATYDDQAISIFEDIQTMLLPVTSWDHQSGEYVKAMQVVTWDETGLQVRGRIDHIDTPRRGTFHRGHVITVSGKEALTTNLTDPDNPVAGGRSRLAWNAGRLIPVGEYWLQVEADHYGWYWWDWMYPIRDATSVSEVVVTRRDAPNEAIAFHDLEAGRILGILRQDPWVVFLQQGTYDDDSETTTVWARAYNFADPLAPSLVSDAAHTLDSRSFLRAMRAERIGGTDSTVWLPESGSEYPLVHAYAEAAIWPGYYYGDSTILVTELDPSGNVRFLGELRPDREENGFFHGNWYWSDPYVLSSLNQSKWIDEDPDDGTPGIYEITHRLVAYDLSQPSSPIALPSPLLASPLLGVEETGMEAARYLYLSGYDAGHVIEIGVWDGSQVLPLLEKTFPRGEHSHQSFQFAPPYVLHRETRYSSNYNDRGTEWTAWWHDPVRNALVTVETMTLNSSSYGQVYLYDDLWISREGTELTLLQADPEAEEAEDKLFLLDRVELPFDLYYDLGEAVVTGNRIALPAGLYGVDLLEFTTPVPSRSLPFQPMRATATRPGAASRLAGQTAGWEVVAENRWRLWEEPGSDPVGLMENRRWLFRPKALQDPDSQSVDAGNLWRHSSWLGLYRPIRDTGWVRHENHGYWYIQHIGGEDDGFLIGDIDLGTLWSREDLMPWMYAVAEREWVFFLGGNASGNLRYFFGQHSGNFLAGDGD